MSYTSILNGSARQGAISALAADETDGVLHGGASRDTLSAERGLVPLCLPVTRPLNPGRRDGERVQEVR